MAAMKIVCMIGTPAYLHYFVNEIARHHEIALVIREDARRGGGIFKKIRSKGIINITGLIFNRIRNRKKKQAICNAVFGNEWQHLSPAFPVFNTADINSDVVKQKLQEIKPDLVLVHGTSLIRHKILAGIPLVLNLHWGLSPYYKGSYCTEWALINKDPFNIGYTIHRITAGIDSGEILTQGRLDITPADTAAGINMLLTKNGTGKMIEVIDRIKHAEQPVFKEQDHTQGNLYLVKHWTKKQESEIAALEKEESIHAMLVNPSKKALPIVEWQRQKV
jgi:methionyl-tRNA formyltransferase